MGFRVVRLGSARSAGEGTRIGTVRRPPRGVPRAEFASGDWYDAWYPELSPTADLVKLALESQHDRSTAGEQAWDRFARAYRTQMREPGKARAIGLLAAMSHHAAFSIGCYCENEARCHRSLLRDLLLAQGAQPA